MKLFSQRDESPRLPEYENEASFTREVLENGSPTLVCFYARWCGFCMMFKPYFMQAAEATPNLRFAWADISDWDSEMWDTYKIGVVPTLIFFRDGHPVDRVDGISGRGLKRSDLEAIIKRADGNTD